MSRSQGYASYEERLNRVVDHIHDHLEEEIDLNRLAEVACLSPYHWHRIYTAMRGETIGATVRRLRLLRAADRLANSAMPIADIAERAGYGSSDAFGRAFREAYGKAPADYRANGSHATFKAAIDAGRWQRLSDRDRDPAADALRRHRPYRVIPADRQGDGAALHGARRPQSDDTGSKHDRDLLRRP